MRLPNRARTSVILATWLAIGCVCQFQEARAATTLDDLTGSWRLFVDDHIVASRSGLVRTYHPFTKHPSNPVLRPDRAWEGRNVYVYGSVLPGESGGYRLWYHCLNMEVETDRARALYATSADGVNWSKPNLGIVDVGGSTDNNIFITPGCFPSVMHTPWDLERPYKLIRLGDEGRFLGSWSADGIHWTESPGNPVIPPVSDVGNFAWDARGQRYMGYPKVGAVVNNLARRAVGFMATEDFENWPAAALILEPDAIDDRWVPSGTVQRTHFYGLSAFAYESMYIGFLWVFRATDAEGYHNGPIFIELVTSHDGVHWLRQEGDRPPILPLGAAGTWDDGMLFTVTHPLVEGDTIRLYYGGTDALHAEQSQWDTAIGLATLRKDGFASLDAGLDGGSVTTRPLSGATGTLRVNCEAGAGSVRVEVLDEAGNPLPGYGASDCVPLQGDGVSQVVSWSQHTELPGAPAVIRLRFVVQSAALYSFNAGESSAILDVAPVISNVTVTQVLSTRATVAFDTDKPASGVVRYGLAPGELTGIASAPNLSTSRSITLTGLIPETDYFFAVEAADTAGLQSSDDSGGSCFTFKTSMRQDYFTEVFSGGSDAFNLAYRSVMFRPAGTQSYYVACSSSGVTALPSDPQGGTVLSLTDDSYATVTLPAGIVVWHYGTPYTRFHVGSNGYVTFGAGDTAYSRTTANYFRRLRIAALFDDLDPSAGGTVGWKQFSDRVAVTWDNVPEFGTTNSNTFQVEMFFTGDIRVSWLGVASTASIVGLSGTVSGEPADFLESRMASYAACSQRPVALLTRASTRMRLPGEIVLNAVDDGRPDPPGALTYAITSLPTVGVLAGADGAVISTLPHLLPDGGHRVWYTPGPAYRGFDTFTFKANDGGIFPDGGDSDPGVVEIVSGDTPGDLDHDGDVDQEDFGQMQRCFSGAFIPQPDPDCREATLDGDDDVDQADFARFDECQRGANVLAPLDCTG